MSSDQDTTQPHIRRDDTLYFDDGDVVLSAKQTYARNPDLDREVFRVDKLVLSRHSPVFAGMFKFPAVPGVNEEYDGVPMVQLDEDSNSLRELLTFMYRPK